MRCLGVSLDLIWDGHGEQILLLFTVGPLSWCVFEFYLGWIWECLGKQILTLFTVVALSWCVFEFDLGWIWEGLGKQILTLFIVAIDVILASLAYPRQSLEMPARCIFDGLMKSTKLLGPRRCDLSIFWLQKSSK